MYTGYKHFEWQLFHKMALLQVNKNIKKKKNITETKANKKKASV